MLSDVVKPSLIGAKDLKSREGVRCRLITYRHRFARVAPAPRAKRNDDSKKDNSKIRRIVDAHRPSRCARRTIQT